MTLKITRRLMAGLMAAGTVTTPALAVAKPAKSKPLWPKDFLWGTATAAHQIEGGNIGSDYWVLEHIEGTNFKEPSGDACDSWNRWPEDVAILKALGVNCYRFSIEWARIEPERGEFSVAALEHYRRQCAALREAGILPIVTFHHFTNPRWVAGQGGWENPQTAEDFARYCDKAARYLGDLIGMACTINEPNAQVNSYIIRGDKPFEGEAVIMARAGKAIGSERFSSYFMGNSFTVRDVCIRAHQLGRDAIKNAVPGLKVGMTLALQDLVKGEGDTGLYQRMFDNARRPFYEACAKDDFLGVQPYMRYFTGPKGYLPARTGVPLNQHNAEVSPDVISAVVREAVKYCGAPIMITENGVDTTDDALRARHLEGTLAELNSVMASGAKVLGYIHWSLLDNFEWRSGYGPKFGLYAVDRTTFKRTPKPSAARYKALIKTARQT